MRSPGAVEQLLAASREAEHECTRGFATMITGRWGRYDTVRGPTIETRTRQWNQVFAQESRRDFVLVLENRNKRLIGFTWGRPHEGEIEGELSKICLRWEYHGLGLGRRMMAETARRFLERGIHSFVLFAELSNPTLGFYDRMGGERLRDDRGQFSGAYGGT